MGPSVSGKSRVIQQLRGLAIVLVVLYHLNVQMFHLGYLGVDMFFVISGFVIMKSCFNQHAKKYFSIRFFLLRRIVRLMPALSIMTLVTSAFSIFLLPPALLTIVNSSAIFGLLNVSNLFFYRSLGNYFTPASQLNPLLHLWSLSIEFQFYVLISLIFWLLSRYTNVHRLLIMTLAVISIFSLLLSLRPLSGEPFYGYTFMSGFYGSPSRLWQFLSGSLVFLFIRARPVLLERLLLLRLLSIVLILFSLIIELENMIVVNRLMIVLGTALLIWEGQQRLSDIAKVEKNLIGSIFETLGNLSYSIYLWHFPFIALGKLLFPFQSFAPFLGFVISLPLSFLSYKFLEISIQERFSGNRLGTSHIILGFSIVITLPLLTLASLSRIQSIYPNPESFERANQHPAMARGCIDQPLNLDKCTFNVSNQGKRGVVVVLGDSQAYAAATGVIRAAEELRLEVLVYSSSGCPFFVQNIEVEPDSRCSEYRRSATNFILNSPPSVVYIANRTTGYLTRDWRWNLVEEMNSSYSTTDPYQAAKIWLRNLDETLRILTSRGTKVIIHQNIPDINLRSFVGVNTTVLGFKFPFFANFSTTQIFADRNLALRFANVGREIEENLSNKYFEDVFLIDSIDLLCNEVSCPLFQREKPIYLDWGHTSPYGSLLFTNTIKKVLSRAITNG